MNKKSDDSPVNRTLNNAPLILIADDDEDIRFALKMMLNEAGYRTQEAADVKEALVMSQRLKPDLVLLDMNFRRDTTSGQEGLDALTQISTQDCPVVLMTAWATIALAVEGIKKGAADFIQKPWSQSQLLSIVATHTRLTKENKKTESKLPKSTASSADWVAESPAMQQVEKVAKAVARSDANILITGENGVGKSLLAQRIHDLSQRSGNPFVPVNVSTLPHSLFESELFGHKKGAFTDAKSDKKGRFSEAENGTLFLDEISTLDIRLQPKLLQVLESNHYQPVGAEQTCVADVRLISATNSDLATQVQQGEFRQDLLFRLNTIEIEIPPLRARHKDIVLLAERFLKRFADKYSRPQLQLSASAESALLNYPWPGNVRELSNIIERAVLLSEDSVLDASNLSLTLAKGASEYISTENSSELPANITLEQAEKQLIKQAMTQVNGNQSSAAKILGISRHALSRRLEKYEF